MLMVTFMRTHGKNPKKNLLVLDKKILSKKEEVVIALINNEHNYAIQQRNLFLSYYVLLSNHSKNT